MSHQKKVNPQFSKIEIQFLQHLHVQKLHTRDQGFYGFRFSPKSHELKILKSLNQKYESAVWGHCDDADQKSLASDERQLLKFLNESIYGLKVLEVGAGSGRITEGLVKVCESVTACEREVQNIRRLKLRLKSKVKTLHCDFSKANPTKGKKYSAVLLLENLLGMNPLFQDRKRIIQNAFRSTLSGGVVVFSVRVDSMIADQKIRYQAMPYQWGDFKTLGFAVNWGPRAILKEVKEAVGVQKLLKVIEGSKRPAGGRMFHYVLIKE